MKQTARKPLDSLQTLDGFLENGASVGGTCHCPPKESLEYTCANCV